MIARNVARDQFGRQQPIIARGGSEFMARVAQLPDGDLYEAADSQLPEREEIELVRRAVTVLKEQVSEQAWKILWETAIRGRTSTEVASEFNATPAAVRKSKARTLQQLRQLLVGLMPEVAASLA